MKNKIKCERQTLCRLCLSIGTDVNDDGDDWMNRIEQKSGRVDCWIWLDAEANRKKLKKDIFAQALFLSLSACAKCDINFGSPRENRNKFVSFVEITARTICFPFHCLRLGIYVCQCCGSGVFLLSFLLLVNFDLISNRWAMLAASERHFFFFASSIIIIIWNRHAM